MLHFIVRNRGALLIHGLHAGHVGDFAGDANKRSPAIARGLEANRVWGYQVRQREQKTGQRTS
jgi:hypothetical protein